MGVTDHDYMYINLPWNDNDWEKTQSNDFLFLRGFEASHPIGHITCLGVLPETIGIDTVTARKNECTDVNFDAGYKRFLKRAFKEGAYIALNHPFRWRGQIKELIKTKNLI